MICRSISFVIRGYMSLGHTHIFGNINKIESIGSNMSYVGISDKVVEKLQKVVNDKTELDMIIDLLQKEKHYVTKADPHTIRKEFQLLLAQYFPLRSQDD